MRTYRKSKELRPQGMPEIAGQSSQVPPRDDGSLSSAPCPKLSVREAAMFLSLSKSTLDKLRVTGGGPEYLMLGRRIVYDPRDLECWAGRRRRANTSQDRTITSKPMIGGVVCDD